MIEHTQLSWPSPRHTQWFINEAYLCGKNEITYQHSWLSVWILLQFYKTLLKFNSMLKVGDTHTTQPSHQERILKTQKIELEVIFISNHTLINNKLGVWRPKALVINLFCIKPFLSCRLSSVGFLHVNVISYLHLQTSIKKTCWKCDKFGIFGFVSYWKKICILNSCPIYDWFTQYLSLRIGCNCSVFSELGGFCTHF